MKYKDYLNLTPAQQDVWRKDRMKMALVWNGMAAHEKAAYLKEMMKPLAPNKDGVVPAIPTRIEAGSTVATKNFVIDEQQDRGGVLKRKQEAQKKYLDARRAEVKERVDAVDACRDLFGVTFEKGKPVPLKEFTAPELDEIGQIIRDGKGKLVMVPVDVTPQMLCKISCLDSGPGGWELIELGEKPKK
jgi:hypothetical protein